MGKWAIKASLSIALSLLLIFLAAPDEVCATSQQQTQGYHPWNLPTAPNEDKADRLKGYDWRKARHLYEEKVNEEKMRREEEQQDGAGKDEHNHLRRQAPDAPTSPTAPLPQHDENAPMQDIGKKAVDLDKPNENTPGPAIKNAVEDPNRSVPADSNPQAGQPHQPPPIPSQSVASPPPQPSAGGTGGGQRGNAQSLKPGALPTPTPTPYPGLKTPSGGSPSSSPSPSSSTQGAKSPLPDGVPFEAPEAHPPPDDGYEEGDCPLSEQDAADDYEREQAAKADGVDVSQEPRPSHAREPDRGPCNDRAAQARMNQLAEEDEEDQGYEQDALGESNVYAKMPNGDPYPVCKSKRPSTMRKLRMKRAICQMNKAEQKDKDSKINKLLRIVGRCGKDEAECGEDPDNDLNPNPDVQDLRKIQCLASTIRRKRDDGMLQGYEDNHSPPKYQPCKLRKIRGDA